jgi:hypothetical protein
VTSCAIIVTAGNTLRKTFMTACPLSSTRHTSGLAQRHGGHRTCSSQPPEDRRRTWPVSMRVNRTGTGDDDPTLISRGAA